VESTRSGFELIELAAERGDVDELRRLADSGNATAARNWPSSPLRTPANPVTDCDLQRLPAVTE
jgi:hypothetical protein